MIFSIFALVVSLFVLSVVFGSKQTKEKIQESEKRWNDRHVMTTDEALEKASHKETFKELFHVDV